MTILSFAAKSLAGRHRRYLFLGIAVAFGFFIMTITLGLTEGMLSTVRQKGAFYFSGNVNVTCRSAAERYSELDLGLLRDSSREALGGGCLVSARSIYYGNDAQLFFGGASVRQRRVIGLDWADERGYAKSVSVVSGSFPADGDEKGALISKTAADRLGAHVGDELMLIVNGRKGKNTADFVLRGVFKDSSIFGYATYVSRRALNRALAQSDDYASDFGVMIPGIGRSEARAAEKLRSALGTRASVFEVAHTKDEIDDFTSGNWTGKKYLVCTLDAHLSDVKQILEAIGGICNGLLAAFLAVVLIGIINTYRVVVYQRSAEIGMMRALGMSKLMAMGIFAEEASIMAACASAMGLIVGIGFLSALSLVSFPPSLDMFLTRGHLAWALDPLNTLGAFVIVCLSALFAALVPARNAAKIMPMDAMRTED